MCSLILEPTKSIYRKHDEGRICQGDVFSDIRYSSFNFKENETDEKEIIFPFVLILTQDCDLAQDYDDRAMPQEFQNQSIDSILVAPLFLSEQLREGTHLVPLGYKTERLNSNQWRMVKENRDCRYHFLPQDLDMQISETVIDFKHVFTLPRMELYKMKNNYIATVAPLFREHLSQRYANYVSRIGLPDIKPLSSEVITEANCT